MPRMSEANMLVKINEAITEETTFDNKLDPNAGAEIYCHEPSDMGGELIMGFAQRNFIYQLIEDLKIIPSQNTKFVRLAWNRIVELKKDR